MDVSKIISKSRIQSWMSVWQKSDALMLDDLNIVYKEIFSRLATKSKKYTRQTYYTKTAVWQHEYSIPTPTVTDTWIKRVLNINIKYSSNGDYIPCKVHDTSFPIDNDYTNTNKPYCIIRDGSIFVYPAPTKAISDWIIVEWQYLPLDLELTTLSVSIKLWSEYHDVMISGLNMWNFGDKQLFDKKALSKQEYEDWITRIIDEWWSDPVTAFEWENSDVEEVSQDFLP